MYIEWAPRAIFNANLHDNLMATVRPVVFIFLSMQLSIFLWNPECVGVFFKKF